MAPRRPLTLVILMAVLLAVPLVLAGQTEGDPLISRKGDGLIPGSSLVTGPGNCTEVKLYRGPCVDVECSAACVMQLHSGGYCIGKVLRARCYCFACL